MECGQGCISCNMCKAEMLQDMQPSGSRCMQPMSWKCDLRVNSQCLKVVELREFSAKSSRLGRGMAGGAIIGSMLHDDCMISISSEDLREILHPFDVLIREWRSIVRQYKRLADRVAAGKQYSQDEVELAKECYALAKKNVADYEIVSMKFFLDREKDYRKVNEILEKLMDIEDDMSEIIYWINDARI